VTAVFFGSPIYCVHSQTEVHRYCWCDQFLKVSVMRTS